MAGLDTKRCCAGAWKAVAMARHGRKSRAVVIGAIRRPVISTAKSAVGV